MDDKNNPVAESISELGKRIAEVAALVGGKKTLSKQTSISESQLYRYISGQSQPTALPLASIAKAGQIDLDWLITGKCKTLTSASTDYKGLGRLETFTEISEYSDDAYPVTETTTPMGKFIFRTEWLHENKLNPQSLRLLHVFGDSMETTICDNDLLMIDTRQTEIIGDAIFALKIDNHLIVKRLQHAIEGGVYIFSDNPYYREQYVACEDLHQLKIIGRVVWSAGKV